MNVLVELAVNFFCPLVVFLPTNCTNFRASECKTELVRVMPSAAENVKEIDTNCFNGLNGDRVGRTNCH